MSGAATGVSSPIALATMTMIATIAAATAAMAAATMAAVTTAATTVTALARFSGASRAETSVQLWPRQSNLPGFFCRADLLRVGVRGDFAIGETFENLQERGIVEPVIALGRGSLEQLLRGGRRRQRQFHFPRAVERVGEILPVQRNLEAGLERAPQHARAVHLEHAR